MDMFKKYIFAHLIKAIPKYQFFLKDFSVTSIFEMIFIQISFNTRQQISSPKESTFCHKELLSNLSISPQKKKKSFSFSPKKLINPASV